MGGSMEAYRLFYARELRAREGRANESAQAAPETKTENPTIRPITPPIHADKDNETVATSTTAPLEAGKIPSIADAEAGTILAQLVPDASPTAVAAKVKGSGLKDSLAKSKILQSLAAGRDVAGDSSIATAADVEAGTALMEVVPEVPQERGGSMTTTVSS